MATQLHNRLSKLVSTFAFSLARIDLRKDSIDLIDVYRQVFYDHLVKTLDFGVAAQLIQTLVLVEKYDHELIGELLQLSLDNQNAIKQENLTTWHIMNTVVVEYLDQTNKFVQTAKTSKNKNSNGKGKTTKAKAKKSKQNDQLDIE